VRLRQLFEEAPAQKIIAVMPGGFHPFHPGHKSLYDWAVETFGRENVYVAATNDTKARPFPFDVKQKLAAMAGVPTQRFIQVKSPFNALSYESIIGNPAETALVFVRSEKDKTSHPLPDQVRKSDGNMGYLISYTGNDNLETADTHGYLAYGPTIDFDFSGMSIKSASELRAAWPEMSDEDKLQAAELMYPGNAQTATQLLNTALGVKELEPATESNLVIDQGRLRSYIISLIADKIAETDDIEQLAEWLKLIVGKELKARGSRYQISSEDVVEAINMKMRDIVKEENNTPPTKVKPVREPFPQMPQKPTEPVSGENGEIIKPTRNGGVSLGNDAGTFIWDKAGKPSMYITPSINGIKQVHNMKTGNFTVDYRNKGLNIKQEYDKDGNSIGGADTQYSMGGVTVSQDRQGNRSGTHQMGTRTVNFDPNKPFDPSNAG